MLQWAYTIYVQTLQLPYRVSCMPNCIPSTSTVIPPPVVSTATSVAAATSRPNVVPSTTQLVQMVSTLETSLSSANRMVTSSVELLSLHVSSMKTRSLDGPSIPMAFLSDGSHFTIKPTSTTATPTQAPTDENSSSSGASDHNSVAGTFAGIAVGAVIGVTLAIVLAAVVVVRKRKRKRYSPPVLELNENVSYGSTYRDPKVERNAAYGAAIDAASRMVRNTGLGKSFNVNIFNP